VGYHNFGGWKDSRFGDGQMFGPDTARFFTQTKTISERWPDENDAKNARDFDFPTNYFIKRSRFSHKTSIVLYIQRCLRRFRCNDRYFIRIDYINGVSLPRVVDYLDSSYIGRSRSRLWRFGFTRSLHRAIYARIC